MFLVQLATNEKELNWVVIKVFLPRCHWYMMRLPLTLPQHSVHGLFTSTPELILSTHWCIQEWLRERVQSDTLETIRGSLLSPQSPSSPLSLKEPTSQWSSLSLANIIALNVMLADLHHRAGELWEEPLNVYHNEVFPKILGIENQSQALFNEGLDAGLDCSDFLSQENEVLFWKSRLSSFGLDDNSSWINDLFWWNICNLMWCMYWILECCKYSMN